MNNTYTSDLSFHSPCPLKKDASQGRAIANICVKIYSQEAERDMPLISPDCVSMRELNYQIDRLKEEPEKVRTLASKEFTRHDELEREWKKNFDESVRGETSN